MRKTLALLVAGLCLVLASGTALAQSQLEGSIGLGVPTGDLGEYWDSSLSMGGGAFLEVSPFAMAGVAVGYNRFALDKEEAGETATVSVSGGTFSAIHFAGELRVKTGTQDTFVAYGGAGAAFYSVGISDTKFTDGETTVIFTVDRETKIGGYLTAGMVVPVTREFKVGGKAQFHRFSVGEDYGFEDISDTRSFFTLQITAILFF